LSGECDPRAFFIGMSDSYDVVECFDGPDHGGQDQLGIAFRPSHPGGSASSSIISAPTLARVLVHDLEDYNGDPDMRPFDPLISNHHRDVLVSVLDYSQPDMVVKLKLVHFLEPVNEGEQALSLIRFLAAQLMMFAQVDWDTRPAISVILTALSTSNQSRLTLLWVLSIYKRRIVRCIGCCMLELEILNYNTLDVSEYNHHESTIGL
jgi:hypothetical protein